MRIKLYNFRCHLNKTFNFQDDGLVLLSGDSGIGKSTILEAIYYALYGDLKKPYSFAIANNNKESCNVELELKVKNGILKINRNGRPNRLLVEFDHYTYEDDEAQSVIDSNFMNKFEFLASSYIRQRTNVSLISMTPTEQIEFVKNIAFNQDANTKIKTLIKDLIKDTNEDLIKEKKNQEFSQSQLFELNNISPDTFEVKMNPIRVSPEEFNKQIKTIELEIERLKSEKIHIGDEIDHIKDNMKEQELFLKKRQRLEIEVQYLEGELGKFSELDSQDKLETLKNTLNLLKDKRDKYFLYDKYCEDSQLYEELVEDYTNKLNEKIQESKDNLLEDKEYFELNKNYKNYLLWKELKDKVDLIIIEIQNKCPSLLEEFNLEEREDLQSKEDLQSLLEKLKENIPIKVYNCPTCNSSLTLKNDNLETTNLKNNPANLNKTSYFERWIATLENFLSKEHIIFDTNLYQDKIDKHHIAKKELENLTSYQKFPSHILKLKTTIDDIYSEIEDSIQEIESSDITEILEDVSKYEEYLTTQSQLKSKRETLSKELENKYQELQRLKKEGSLNKLENTLSELDKRYKLTSNKIENFLTKLTLYNETKNKILQYKQYIDYLEKIKSWETKSKDYSEKVIEIQKKYDALLKLREKSSHAEILSLQSIVDNINEYAKIYLDIMFPIDPILVRIELFKEVKNDLRYKMNTIIKYKDADYDSVEQLSGGERQKCELAFELAVNSLLNSSILLLDECINNLNESVNTEILEILRDYAREYHKLIILISHECITGGFDGYCELKK